MFISRDFIVAVFVAVIPLAVRAVASVGRSVRTAVLGFESSLSAFPFVVPGWVVSVHLKVTRGGEWQQTLLNTVVSERAGDVFILVCNVDATMK